MCKRLEVAIRSPIARHTRSDSKLIISSKSCLSGEYPIKVDSKACLGRQFFFLSLQQNFPSAGCLFGPNRHDCGAPRRLFFIVIELRKYLPLAIVGLLTRSAVHVVDINEMSIKSLLKNKWPPRESECEACYLYSESYMRATALAVRIVAGD
jgi:hypothetical protein